MAIQYYMRAYNTVLSQYVDWVVNDAPDTTAAFSGYNSGDLAGITVNRVVSSKVENFLKPNQSLRGADGNYFHINSYDWLKATAPINPPTGPVGLAVERGITAITTVTGATNAQPIVITTAAPHGLSANGLVTITGVTGNAAANGTFSITAVSTNGFTLVGSQGDGAYVSGGSVYRPTNFSTLTWDETSNQWRFVFNTNGDGVTLATSQNLRTLNKFVDGYISAGTTAHGTNVQAQSGTYRMPNNQYVVGRNQAGSLDVQLIGVDNLNRIKIGSISGDLTYMPGSLIVDGYITHDGTGTNVSTIGFIREQNNTTIVGFRNAAQDNNIAALSSNASNNVILGDAVNAGTIHNTATNGLHAFQVNTTSFVELGRALTGADTPFDNSAFIRFSQAAPTPVIGQTKLTSGSGASLTVQAQGTSAGAQTGGILRLASGRGTGASGFNGTVDFYTGAPTDGGTLKMTIHPTVAPVAANNNSIQMYQNRLRFDTAQILPRFNQDDVTSASTNGQAMTIQSQNATGSTSVGGNLLLTSGTGTTAAGNVIITTGGVNQIIVTPTLTTILGNLLVNGTTTSIASTVVDIADRVVHFNSSANQFPGTVIPAPTQITGFSVDRGSTTTTVKRDYYGMFWVEADNYWKLSVNTDGYTTENTLSTNLPLMASFHMVQPNAAVISSAIPTVGSYRSLNNVTHSSSRNAAGTQDLLLLGTDATNHIVHGAGTNNAGHIFNTTTATIYDFQVNSVSTYTVTPQSAGTTTLQATAGVTAVVYTQTISGGGTGANTTMSAQSATTTGGNLILSSGAATTAGNLQLQTGAVDRVVVHPTYTEFRDAAEALRITPVSAGTTQITYASTVTAAQINQTTTAGATGAPMTVQAQNAATTGGSLTITSGTGTTAGDVNIQTGAVSKVIVHPTFTEFRDTAEAYRITPVSAGVTTLLAASTVTAVGYRQTDLATGAATGAPTTVQSQNAVGATSTGGALNLTSGTGTTTNGAVNLQVGGTTTASLVTNKFVLNRGLRRNVTTVTGTYAVLATDDLIAVTTLAAPFTITLPATPTVGDSYDIKDATGNAVTNTLTVSGNGANIDGAATFAMTQPYAAATFTFLNGQWSVT